MDIKGDFGPEGTVFVSDIHRGSSFSMSSLFSKFLARIPSGMRVVLVGDTYDFWKRCPSDEEISLLRDRDIIYLIGNHDREILAGSVFSTRISRSLNMELSGKKFLVTHGDVFDTKFGANELPHRIIDCMIYRMSEILGYDFRTRWGFVTKYYYSRATNYIGITNRKLMNAGYQGLVSRHTHCPEFECRDGFWNINLGCWYRDPKALFVSKDGRYKYVSIEEDFPLPSEEDFDSLR